MLTPDQISGLELYFQRMADPINEYLIKQIAAAVRKAGEFDNETAYLLWRAEFLGRSQAEIQKEVQRLTGKSAQEVREIFQTAGETSYSDDVRRLKNGLKFRDNATMRQIVEAAAEMGGASFENLTGTLGFVGPDGKAQELTQAYQSATDFAFNSVSTGAMSYDDAVRRACAALATRGIVSIDYESGIATALEAAIRRNLMSGMGEMVEKINQKNHDDLGCDGWEISAHLASAPDHEPIQGKQYTDKEYESLNGSLGRRIGTLNCGHVAFPIILGVSEPQYSAEKLEEIRRANKKTIVYEGREFGSVYEATQYQRYIERKIRAQQRRVWAASGEKNEIASAKLRRLKQEYSRFCNSTGLRTETERLYAVKRLAKSS